MIRLPILYTLAPVSLLAACATTPAQSPPGNQVPAERPIAPPTQTKVLDRGALERLLANKGVTLQWIDWNTRGTANARWQGETLLLTAAQAKTGADSSGGRLFLDGAVEEIGADYFTFRGTIRIEDTPDAGRRCEKSKTWHFAVTQNRPYWRLREFEWCDGLTDYIDIYF